MVKVEINAQLYKLKDTKVWTFWEIKFQDELIREM